MSLHARQNVKYQRKTVTRPCCKVSVKNRIERGQTFAEFDCRDCEKTYQVNWVLKKNGSTGNLHPILKPKVVS